MYKRSKHFRCFGESLKFPWLPEVWMQTHFAVLHHSVVHWKKNESWTVGVAFDSFTWRFMLWFSFLLSFLFENFVGHFDEAMPVTVVELPSKSTPIFFLDYIKDILKKYIKLLMEKLLTFSLRIFTIFKISKNYYLILSALRLKEHCTLTESKNVGE